ncbi:MAG TPA: hypothetical protein VD704_08425 [Gaiellaceae bacterium]|nr:hypothetical protein [Gaiellaceae bacterium]
MQSRKRHVRCRNARSDPRAWRREQLAQAGFPPPVARRLAADGRYDLHALIELVERGCPPELALRILAPDDGAEPA